MVGKNDKRIAIQGVDFGFRIEENPSVRKPLLLTELVTVIFITSSLPFKDVPSVLPHDGILVTISSLTYDNMEAN